MWLGTESRDFLELSIAGYQFPDSDDPQLKYSWHMIQGRASTASEAWDFRWHALTCDEPVRLAAWLREAAEASALGRVMPAEGPGPISFTEPNLAFEVESYCRDVVVIRVELDLEFRSPSNKPNYYVGHPNVLHIRTSIDKLAAAAADWESDLRRYPDGLSTGT